MDSVVLSLNRSFSGVTHAVKRVAFLGALHPSWPLKRASKVHILSGKFSQLPLHTHTELGVDSQVFASRSTYVLRYEYVLHNNYL